jgi:hypothetical protein
LVELPYLPHSEASTDSPLNTSFKEAIHGATPNVDEAIADSALH